LPPFYHPSAPFYYPLTQFYRPLTQFYRPLTQFLTIVAANEHFWRHGTPLLPAPFNAIGSAHLAAQQALGEHFIGWNNVRKGKKKNKVLLNREKTCTFAALS
jgi:hypothetical protein